MKDQLMYKIRLLALALAGLLITSASAQGAAVTFQEDFSSDPAQRGWQVLGDANLFHWNAADQNLAVTWDSSQPNSYFARPLAWALSGDDDFCFAFDLSLSDFTAGIDPQKPNPFELSVGLINLAQATGTNFVRGSGWASPDLVEFSFFPDPGGAWIWGPSLTAMLCDWTGTNWSYGGFGPLSLTTGQVFHVALTYSSADRTLRTTVTSNGQSIGDISDAGLGANFLDFRVEHLAVCSYSDAGQDPSYAGSLLAHGAVDNFSVSITSAPPPNLALCAMNDVWQVQFLSRTNRLYTLERSADFRSWTVVSPTTPGSGTSLALRDSAVPAGRAFYRVRVDWP